jgi:hypothetical protein
MRSFGSDRVRVRDDGAIVLACRLPKEGWEARVAKTLTRSEHPGTAILWEDAYYEVVDIATLANGVEYTLAPWSEHHTMRVSMAYDAASEAKRAADRRDIARRVKGRRTATILGFLTGHLPAAVQEQLAHETGTNAPLLTMFSAIPELAIAGLYLRQFLNFRMGEGPMPPMWFMLLAGYLALDGAMRGGFAFLSGRPLGSIFGIIGYAIYWMTTPKRAQRIAPLAAPRGEGTFRVEVSDDVALIDSFTTREPFFTLLPANEQARLAQRFDYDYRRHASSIAIAILVIALIGVFSSLHSRAFVSLIVAGYLAAEQLFRLTQLSARPVGSVIGFAIRPFAKKFL